MNPVTIVIFLFVLVSAACKKDTIELLPPITQSGAYTFGFKVDGKVYTANGKEGLLANKYVKYILGNDSLIFITAKNMTNPNFGIQLSIKYPDKIGTYLTKDYPYQGTFSDDNDGTIPGLSNTYTTTNSITGSVTINYFNGTYNPPFMGTVLSGTFQMDAVNGEGKVIHITDGRFDIGQ